MSDTQDATATTTNERLKSFADRLDRLDDDKDAIAADRKEVLNEAKGEGFDTKILNKIVRLRRIDRKKRQEEQELVDTYMTAIGEAP